MDQYPFLQNILEFIDKHITEEIGVGQLAGLAGFSPMAFLQGVPVENRLLGHGLCPQPPSCLAAAELSSGRRILDIALEYGFETHSGFSKAFRRYFGCAPEVYRLHAHCGRPLPPSLPDMIKYPIGGIVLEPKFVTLPAVKLAGFALKTTMAGGKNKSRIPAFWSAYLSGGRMNRLHSEKFVKSHAEYGACFPEDPETGEFEYVIGVETKDGAAVPAEYHVCELPAATYAVFSTPPCTAEKFSSSIQGVWDYIFNEWFPNSGYEYAPGCVDFELYDERCMSETGKICDIDIPVVRKQP